MLKLRDSPSSTTIQVRGRFNETWRSLVAHLFWEQGVECSNHSVSTMEITFRDISKDELGFKKWYPTFGISMGHDSHSDGLDYPGTVNELHCACGTRLWPDCDISQVSINECFDEHRLDMLRQAFPIDLSLTL